MLVSTRTGPVSRRVIPAGSGACVVVVDRLLHVAAQRGGIDFEFIDILLRRVGRQFMPGLIEPHSHLTFPNSIDRKVPGMMPPPERHSYITAHNAKTILDHGYTSAFSGGATRPEIEVALRDEIAAGYLPGPRLKAA